MALIQCPECGRQISDAAHSCPGCGYPIAERIAAAVPDAPAETPKPAPERPAVKPQKKERGWIGLVVIGAVLVGLIGLGIAIAGGSKPGKETDVNATTPELIETAAPSPTAEPAATPLPHISWTKQYYVDDFNDPTDESYIRGRFLGSFSNSATSGSRLVVYIYIDHNLGTKQSDCISIRLFEYEDLPVNLSYIDVDDISVKIKIGDIVYSGIPYKLSEKDICINRDSQLFKPFLKALDHGQEISVLIEVSKYSTTKYRFTVDSYGLGDLEHNWKY